MRWATLVLAVVLVLGWTVTAAGESKWTLWKQNAVLPPGQSAGQIEWVAIQGFAERAECELFKQERWKSAIETVRKVDRQAVVKEEVPYESVVFASSAGFVRIKWDCLPDTIDPREKK